ARIFEMKNSAPDQRSLHAVKKAMEEGVIGREKESQGKRFSKAEALRLWAVLDEWQSQERLRKMFEATPDNYRLITSKEQLDEFLLLVDDEEEIVLDVKTNGDDVW